MDLESTTFREKPDPEGHLFQDSTYNKYANGPLRGDGVYPDGRQGKQAWGVVGERHRALRRERAEELPLPLEEPLSMETD